MTYNEQIRQNLDKIEAAWASVIKQGKCAVWDHATNKWRLWHRDTCLDLAFDSVEEAVEAAKHYKRPKLDQYQILLNEFLNDYATRQNLPRQAALRDMLGDLQVVAEQTGLDFDRALLMIDEQGY